MSSQLRSAQRKLDAFKRSPFEQLAFDRIANLAIRLVAGARPAIAHYAPPGFERWLHDAEIILGPMPQSPKAPEAAQAPAEQPEAAPEAQPAAEADTAQESPCPN